VELVLWVQNRHMYLMASIKQFWSTGYFSQRHFVF
jgi:hypothetical protein